MKKNSILMYQRIHFSNIKTFGNLNKISKNMAEKILNRCKEDKNFDYDQFRINDLFKRIFNNKIRDDKSKKDYLQFKKHLLIPSNNNTSHIDIWNILSKLVGKTVIKFIKLPKVQHRLFIKKCKENKDNKNNKTKDTDKTT